jgi:Glucose / Sorbosone dehydrogenase/RTX calcium-binding nonapeptide repeat (4 copies)
LILAATAVAAAWPAQALAATSLSPIGTFDHPVYVTSLPDPDKLLVVEQEGRIELVKGGIATNFLDISAAVASGGERGLLSVAPAPNFGSSGHFYVYYTAAGSGDIQIDRYTASGDTASAATRTPVLRIAHSEFANHNGGQLQFGPDGYLYLATGDGGSGGDPHGNAQNLNSLLGKVLRIDPRPSQGRPYSTPPSNPFAGTAPGLDEIWSYGLRNPWRFSFDLLTGDLLIGDVGQSAREEVDYSRHSAGGGRGLNFGWNCREGLIAFNANCAGLSGFTDPILDYDHSRGGCAIVGGYVVRDKTLSGLYGRYLYSDECAGEIRSLIPSLPRATDDRSEGLLVPNASSFGEDSCGRVYVASLSTGVVSQFVDGAPQVCTGPITGAAECAGRAATRLPAANGTVFGSPGSDVLVGDERANRIRGRGGDDIICALGGADRIRGGPGRDVLHAGPGNDRCRSGPGKDKQRSC